MKQTKKQWMGFFAVGTFAVATLCAAGEVGTGEYKFPAEVDPEVLSFRATEVWAKVHYPKEFSKAPLLVFLHGNHGTCGRGSNPRIDNNIQYTFTGTCPEGYVVVPNHEGYDYLAEEMASKGYIVFSINANRGITASVGGPDDFGLNLARGRLVLKHISLWKKWATEGGAPESIGLGANGLLGRVDFSHVGMMGHSRGGEGVRAAHYFLRDATSVWSSRLSDVKIEGIFEIGAVDGQTSKVLDAPGIPWNQLIPTCDGDVSSFEGINPFNRMLRQPSEPLSAQKSVTLVYGANHNYFNSEWQTSDAEPSECRNHLPIFSNREIGSEAQKDVAKILISRFFEANVGPVKNRELNRVFDPAMPELPEIARVAKVERDFSPSPSSSAQVVLDDFIYGDTSMIREASPGVTLELLDAYDSTAPYLQVAWETGKAAELSVQWQDSRDLSLAKTFDFRFSLSGLLVLAQKLDFEVSLVDARGARSFPVRIADILGHAENFSASHGVMFETARIPMELFQGVDKSSLRGVHFSFAGEGLVEMNLANLRFTNFFTNSFGAEVAPQMPVQLPVPFPKTIPMSADLETRIVPISRNRVISLIPPTQPGAFGASSIDAEITFESDEPFRVRDALPVLQIGKEKFKISQVDPASGRITFRIPAQKWLAFRKTAPEARMSYQGSAKKVWNFGPIRF